MFGRFIALRKAAEISRLRPVVTGFAALVLFNGAFAQAADLPTKTGTTPYGTTTWGGLNWGIGIAADFDVNGSRVNTAQIVAATNGVPAIVRIDSTSSNANVGFVLEAHYFLRDFPLYGKMGMNCSPALAYCGTEVGIGPFVAIEVGNGASSTPGADKLVTGYALGLMVGFHHNPLIYATGLTDTPKAPVDNKSWNIGLGLRVDPGAQVLGDGFVANQPPPAGETQIRYKTEPRLGVMLLSSFSF